MCGAWGVKREVSGVRREADASCLTPDAWRMSLEAPRPTPPAQHTLHMSRNS